MTTNLKSRGTVDRMFKQRDDSERVARNGSATTKSVQDTPKSPTETTVETSQLESIVRPAAFNLSYHNIFLCVTHLIIHKSIIIYT